MKQRAFGTRNNGQSIIPGRVQNLSFASLAGQESPMSSGALVRVDGLQELLDRCQRLIRVHSLFRGLAETLCVLIAGIVFACVLDYFIVLPGFVRLGLLASTAIVTSIVAWRRLIHPVMAGTPDDELAAAVDLRFPELQESLATLVSIEAPTATASETGSLLMRERLQKHVQNQIRHVQPSAVIRSGTTIKRVALAVISVIAIAIPLSVWPSGSSLLMQRFVMPFANLAAATNLYFEVPDGNRTVATNSDVVFTAIPQWRSKVAEVLPTDVVLEMKTASGEYEELEMAFDESAGRFAVTIVDVRDSIQYRVVGGGAATEWFTMTVADPPRILSALLRETPPPYTGRPIETYDGIVGDISVFERSQIEMVLQFNKPVQTVRIEWKNWTPIESTSSARSGEEMTAGENQNPLPEEIAAAALAPVPGKTPEPPMSPTEISPDGLAAIFRFEALGGGPFEFSVEDSLGLANSVEPSRRLIVTTDTPPQLTVSGLTDGLEVRPDDVVPLNCKAVDDLGLGVLEMQFQRNNDAVRIEAADPFDRGALSATHDFRLDLKTLNAVSGDTVTFRVRTADERPVPGPQVVWKGPWTIRIADDAEPLGAKPLREADQQLVDALRKMEEQLKQDADKASELKNQTRQQWDDEAKDDVRELSEKEQTQGRQLQQLAEQVAAHPLMQKQAEKLSELAQQIRQDVPTTLNEAAAAESDSASRKLQESANELEQIRNELHKAADEVEDLAKLEQELAELNRLALDAQQLAKDSEQLRKDREANQPEEGQSPEERQQQLDQKQEELAQDQQKLTDDLNRLLQRKQELLQAAREAQLDQMAEVAEQLQTLAQQQQQLAEGVNEESRDAARDVQQLANELQKARNQAEQLGNEIQQKAADVTRPDVKPLDEAINELRQGNLAEPQRGMQEAQDQLAKAAEQLNKPIEASPVDPNAPQDENARLAEEKKLADQNQARSELSEQAKQLTEQIKQLEKQLADMSEKLGAKPNAEKRNAEQADSAQANDQQQKAAEKNSSDQNAGDQNAGQQKAGEQNAGDQKAANAESAAPKNAAADSPKPASTSADVSRAMLEQLDKMREAAHEQAEAVKSDPTAANGAKEHSSQAASRADDAMRNAQAGQFQRAAEQMRNASRESSQASNALTEESQQDRQAQLQQQGENFNRMSDTLQQMQQDNSAQVATQQDTQRDVAEAAQSLPEPLNELAERLNHPALGLQQQARPAQEAAEAASEAAKSGSEAADQLDQTQMQQASQSAQKTAENLNRAAQQAKQAAQGHRDPNAKIPSEVGESVNDALQSLQKASQLRNEEAARQAAKQQAEQSGQQGPEGEPGQQPGKQSGQGQSGEKGQPAGEMPGEGQPGQQPGQQPGDGKSSDGQAGQGEQDSSQSGSQGQPGEGQPGQGQSGQKKPGSSSSKNSASEGKSPSSSQQLANAARALQSAAERALPNKFSPGQLNSDGSSSSSDPQAQGNPALFDGQNPNATTRKGKSRQWGQLQDDLNSDIGDAGKEVLDNEYSELIRRYRRDLARSADKDATRKPDPKK
jgi:hypothetical protein